MKGMVREMFKTCIRHEERMKYLPALPHKPEEIFSQMEIDGTHDAMEKIFYSYFTSKDVKLNATMDFDIFSEFGNMLFCIYYKKNGKDGQVSDLLKTYPILRALMDEDIFKALYAPHIKSTKTGDISYPDPDSEFHPQYVYLGNELHPTLRVVDLIHDKRELVREVVGHICRNAAELYDDLD
jgi:hypothetical protein